MATQYFINECKNRANANRLGKFTIDNLAINQNNYLKSIELKDSCYVNDTIIGSIFTKSADVELLNLPLNTKLEGKIISPQIGVKYNDASTEYVEFDDYTIESLKDEQTASNTGFIAMSGGTLLEKEYICGLSFEDGETHTIYEFYEDVCSQIGLTPTDNEFDNGGIMMVGNPFTNKESCRVVLEEIERVSCSIIEFDWKNSTITLKWLSNTLDYEFNTSDYSTLEGSLTKYGPLNVIIIGNSQFDGENVTMTDAESVALNGEHQIMIDAPYFLYNEGLRSQAIQAIYNKLDGLTYYDLKLTTPYGKPFLKIGDKIRINTNENQVYDTYVLSHTFTYDGTFKSIIESPALTSEEQTIKNEFKGKSVKEKIQRTEVMVDKIAGDVTAITERVKTTEDNLGNVYTIEQVNTLVQNAIDGVTNQFTVKGGNNLLRNTGLWATTDDENNPYEFWNGLVERVREENAVNSYALLLQNNTLSQQVVDVKNGTYTLSFNYKKLITLSNPQCIINDKVIDLTEEEDTPIEVQIEVGARTVDLSFITDVDNSCIVYDLMLNSGESKSEYSQNENETTTDTVNISKGITITSTETDVTFKANSTGIRTLDRYGNKKTEFTDIGMETSVANITEEAQITGLLHRKVGNHIWVTKI